VDCRRKNSAPGFTLITQNVDGLHDLAGSKNMIKLHGAIWVLRCLGCGRERVDRAALSKLPPYSGCGAMMRPGVVWFGEMLPDGAMERAVEAVQRADAVIVAGTSARVCPASW
jgi:NAD-dependent deacetylase